MKEGSSLLPGPVEELKHEKDNIILYLTLCCAKSYLSGEKKLKKNKGRESCSRLYLEEDKRTIKTNN